MKLEKWSVVSNAGIALAPPEQGPQYLFGVVHGHPHHADGKQVRTSRLVYRKGGCVVTKSGSNYELGEAHPAYEAEYPDARRRLMAALEVQPEEPQVRNELLSTSVGAQPKRTE